MSDLSHIEKRKLERLFCMGGGYVLNFSNRTFSEFFEEYNIDIDNEIYMFKGDSKANRLRAFWKIEDNYTVGNVIEKMILFGQEEEDSLCSDCDARDLLQDCLRIAQKLKTDHPISGFGMLVEVSEKTDFNLLAEQVRDAIQKNQPQAGLDRLHTYVIKFIRKICIPYGIEVNKTKALHSIFGEYIKVLRASGRIESEMTVRILKSSISILESFNFVRNEQSLAHDNEILNYDESMYIYTNVCSLVRLIKSIEKKVKIKDSAQLEGEIPF